MGATGSEPSGAEAAARRPRRGPRLTLRLRLTLLYAACLIIAGAAVLGVTYAVFTGSQAQVTVVGSLEAGPGSAGRGGAISLGSGGGGVTSVHVSGTGGSPPSQKDLRTLERQVQRQSRKQIAYANLLLHRQRTGDASALLEISAVALGVIALLAIGLAWLLAGRALRPLRTINARARRITEESLHERLGEGLRDDELGELAETFDALLGRLERAFDSQRRFVANASHELRTPLTLERALVEVALADPDASVASLRQVCERVLASSEQQERLIDALLTLARSQAGSGERTEIELAAVVREALTVRGAELAALELTTELQPARISGDPALIERLVANLLDNAIVHNHAAAPWVRVETETVEREAILRVSNGGAALPPARLLELFEPFRRLEGERTAGDGGLGLGLSIVDAIAKAHDASLEARPLEPGGLSVELRFVAAPVTVGAA